MGRKQTVTSLVALTLSGSTSACYDAVGSGTGEYDALSFSGSSTASASSVDGQDSSPASVPSYAAVAQTVTYGYSVERRPLELTRISSARPTTGLRPAILLLGGVHGGEGIDVLESLTEVLADAWVGAMWAPSGAGYDLPSVRQFISEGGVIYVASTVNPDGMEATTRDNANGVDLNRDWNAQTQPETRYLAEYLRAEAEFSGVDLRLMVDYHVGIPRLLYPRSGPGEPISSADLQEHLTVHELLPQRIRKVPVSLYDSIRDIYAEAPTCEQDNDCVFNQACADGDWNCGCLHEPTAWDGGRCVMEPTDPVQIGREGLSNDYFYETFGAMSFVYEADVAVDASNVPDHAEWIERSVRYLLTGEVEEATPRFEVHDVMAARRPLSHDHLHLAGTGDSVDH